jgi:DNA-binding beta-propeller fold protein YncE
MSARCNVSTTAQSTYQMPFKTFPVQPCVYNTTFNTSRVIKYLSLPGGSMPMGIVYNPYNSMVYVALYGTSQLAEINKTDFSYSLYSITYGAWMVAIDGFGHVWITPSHRNCIAKFDIITKQIQYLELGAYNYSNCLTFHNGYVWVGADEVTPESPIVKAKLLKINPTNNTVVSSYVISISEYCPKYNGYIHFIPRYIKGYGDKLWISLYSDPSHFKGFEGRIVRFDILSGNVTVLTPFDRPWGIEVDENFVYVAENSMRQQFYTVVSDISSGQRWFIVQYENYDYKLYENDKIRLYDRTTGVSEWKIIVEAKDVVFEGGTDFLNVTVDTPFENYYTKFSTVVTDIHGRVAKLDKSTLTTQILYTCPILQNGPCHVLKDSYGYLWFTTNYINDKFGIVGGATWNNIIYLGNGTLKYFEGYSLTEVPTHSSEIWFCCKGSAYIVMKDTGTLGNTDINKDGKVDITDVASVSKWFGSLVPPAPINVDLNADGKIDITDVAIVSRNYGKTL